MELRLLDSAGPALGRRDGGGRQGVLRLRTEGGGGVTPKERGDLRLYKDMSVNQGPPCEQRKSALMDLEDSKY